MTLKVIQTELPDVLLLEPQVFEDARGFFLESFNAREFAQATGFAGSFVQDNHSRSVKHVLRGLHYQMRFPQGKLVRVIAGEIVDVAVDVRRHSATFGRWTRAILSSTNRRQMWIPAGHAHGFLVLSEAAEVCYKTTDYWDASSERCLRWNAPELRIDWPLEGAPLLAPKDAKGDDLSTAVLYE